MFRNSIHAFSETPFRDISMQKHHLDMSQGTIYRYTYKETIKRHVQKHHSEIYSETLSRHTIQIYVQRHYQRTAFRVLTRIATIERPVQIHYPETKTNPPLPTITRSVTPQELLHHPIPLQKFASPQLKNSLLILLSTCSFLLIYDTLSHTRLLVLAKYPPNPL